MATLKPFPAVRPRPDLAAEVCEPPYDVMNREEAKAMAEGNPHSFLRVSRPEIEMPDEADPYSPEVYEHGAANMRKMIESGVLVQDEKPHYYLYRLVMGDHSQLGLVAAASCQEYDEDVIRKHELTRPDKEDDRTRHIKILGAQTGPVFLTYESRPSIDSLLAEQVRRDPDVDFTAPDGIRHSLWVVSDETVMNQIEDEFHNVPALYVADGHHRSAAASRVAKEMAAENPDQTGDEAWNYFLTVTFPDDQMKILGYNRAVKDLNGLSEDDVLAKLSEVGEISDAPASHEPAERHELTFYLGGKWRLLTWKKDITSVDDPVAALDVSILQSRVLEPVLNIGDPRTDKRISFIGGIRGTKELKRLVDNGDYAIAFAMHPTSVEELIQIADAGGLMPPKSTWFEPKLRDAMAIHLIG